MKEEQTKVATKVLTPKINEIVAPVENTDAVTLVKKPYNKRRKRKPIAITAPATPASLTIEPAVIIVKSPKKLNIFKRIGNYIASFLKAKYTQFKLWLSK